MSEWLCLAFSTISLEAEALSLYTTRAFRMPDSSTQQPKNPYTIAFAIVGEIGIEIAAPVVVFTMIGKRIDVQYGTGSKALIASFAVAFLVSASIVWKRAQAMKRMYLTQ